MAIEQVLPCDFVSGRASDPQLLTGDRAASETDYHDSRPTSFNSNYSIRYADDEKYPAVVDPPLTNLTTTAKLGSILDKIWIGLSRRSKRRAKYPSPVDQYFQQLEVWKLLAGFAGFLAVVGTFHSSGFISEESMHELFYCLSLAVFLLMVAHSLQEIFPEVAVLAMLAGVGLVVTSLHTVGLKALPVHGNTRLGLLFILVPGYILLLLLHFYKIVKEDVREPEEINKDTDSSKEIKENV